MESLPIRFSGLDGTTQSVHKSWGQGKFSAEIPSESSNVGDWACQSPFNEFWRPYCDTTQCDGILRVWIYYTVNLILYACLLRLDPIQSPLKNFMQATNEIVCCFIYKIKS